MPPGRRHQYFPQTTATTFHRRLAEVARRFYGVLEQTSGSNNKPRSLLPAMRKAGVM